MEPVNDGLPSTVYSILLLPIGVEGSVVVIGTNNGVFTSFDKGDTWNKVSNDGLGGHTNVWALSTTPVALALITPGRRGALPPDGSSDQPQHPGRDTERRPQRRRDALDERRHVGGHGGDPLHVPVAAMHDELGRHLQ